MPKRLKATSLFWVNFFTGISDGLVLPFVACTLAFPFFLPQAEYISLTGIIASLAGALVFGLARYFGELSEIVHHHPRLSLEESAKERALMHHIGIDPGLSRGMELEMDNEKRQWLDEVEEHDLGWEYLDKPRARRGALQTGLGFLCAGLLVQIPVRFFLQAYITYRIPTFIEVLPYCFAPLVALFIFGGCKAVYTGRKFSYGALYALTYGFFTFSFALLIAWLLLQRK